jgi:hypothetical protein
VSLAEEWLPFTDVLPSATIGWASENMPGLIEEWKHAYERNGGGFEGIMSLGMYNPNSTNNNNPSSNGGSSNGSTSNVGEKKKSQPTPEQRRAILKDMQNYSERLSVKS